MRKVRIGLISECKSERKPKGFFGRSKIQKELITLESLGVELVVAHLPYTLKKMYTIKEDRLQRAITNAIRALMSEGVSRAIYTVAVKQIFDTDVDINGFRVFSGTDMFYELLPQAVRHACRKYNVEKLKAKIGISDAGLSKITEYLVKNLCYDSKYISVFTDNKEQASRLSESIFEDVGLALDIKSMDSANYSYKTDIMIDIDKKSIRVGRDFKADNFELDLRIDGYDVDTLDLAECLGYDGKDVGIKYFINGNKRLTL